MATQRDATQRSLPRPERAATCGAERRLDKGKGAHINQEGDLIGAYTLSIQKRPRTPTNGVFLSLIHI
eukprot:2201763-Prorocentrum_lima.AAC.1